MCTIRSCTLSLPSWATRPPGSIRWISSPFSLADGDASGTTWIPRGSPRLDPSFRNTTVRVSSASIQSGSRGESRLRRRHEPRSCIVSASFRSHFVGGLREVVGGRSRSLGGSRAQEVFREAMSTPEIELKVKRRFADASPVGALVDGHERCEHSFEHFSIPVPSPSVKSIRATMMVSAVGGGAKIATVTPTKKIPPSSLPSRTSNVLLNANTRKLGDVIPYLIVILSTAGRILHIDLVKGPHGLGFSVTTRDNPAGGLAPIYVKNILSKVRIDEASRSPPSREGRRDEGGSLLRQGGAIEDGRLKTGDRLLEVNGIEMTGKSQSEAVEVLRSIPPGSRVDLTVSRQEKVESDYDLSPKLPREIPAEKAEEDVVTIPWKHKEILTLDIPVHDSERAGLGVSVKGKTTDGPTGIVDLGIFVKSVIHGGAASKDGRLRSNDQLLHVNGVSLLAKSNGDAMETLRKAMHQEGPTPGVITLTVARRVPSTNSLTRSGRDSASSSALSGSAETLDGSQFTGGEHSGTSENSEQTAIFLPAKRSPGRRDAGEDKENRPLPPRRRPPGTASQPPKIYETGYDFLPSRNPVIDRITGRSSLRNDSYYKATHDTWNASRYHEFYMEGRPPGGEVGFRSPTIVSPSQEMVIIEDEYVAPQPHPRAQPHRPGVRAREEGVPNASDAERMASDASDVAYTSQTSLEDNAPGFSRDQFGRRSMSEKRHAAMDAKNTDTYQRTKKLREERERQKQEQDRSTRSPEDGERQTRVDHASSPLVNDHGPRGENVFENVVCEDLFGVPLSIPLVPSSQMSQAEDGDPALTYRPNPVRVIRGRGCNESFRAAVDRSYDAPLSPEAQAHMETLAEEMEECHVGGGGGGGGGGGVGNEAFPRGGAFQSSSASMPERRSSRCSRHNHTRSHSQPHHTHTHPRTSRPHSRPPDVQTTGKEKKKSNGFLKGLGSMFRFGKHRDAKEGKSAGTSTRGGQSAEERQRNLAAEAYREEQARIHEEYQKLVHRQQQQQHQQQQDQRRYQEEAQAMSVHSQQMMVRGGDGGSGRWERMNQLRADHQRKHQERHGFYPGDSNTAPLPPKRQEVRDGRGDVGQGSQFSASYSHYVNSQEIERHIRSLQGVYHSQRWGGVRERERGREKSGERPLSNFYEYESVAALTRPATALGVSHPHPRDSQGSLPRRIPKGGQIPPSHQYSHLPMPHDGYRSGAPPPPPQRHRPFVGQGMGRSLHPGEAFDPRLRTSAHSSLEAYGGRRRPPPMDYYRSGPPIHMTVPMALPVAARHGTDT
ncbi:unnamed protein product [Darwinula stevensoni]|uniref:PDZ domain-containing protein n=1 Tax=Darwinula stevensoni TaxID=69355 RepID=A0A7R8X426_9CRUS|nr:unnamed protein product [Darwinula stevensoni]CAG0885579.1 unnamed protein product [Darwinula stevensoni]